LFPYLLVVLQSLTDPDLITTLKTGDNAALGEVYDRYGDAMYGFALRMLTQPQEAEDLIQEIFLNLSANCTYQTSRGSLKTYLMMLVHSRSIDRLRSRKAGVNKQQRLQHHEPTHTADTPFETAATGEIAQRVQVALAELPENQQQALKLAYYEGLTQVEIADRLKVPVGTVKSWFRLSFEKLRRKLGDLTT
jgi:RNA polymerase sigma-70 factor, ECF subfamily